MNKLEWFGVIVHGIGFVLCIAFFWWLLFSPTSYFALEPETATEASPFQPEMPKEPKEFKPSPRASPTPKPPRNETRLAIEAFEYLNQIRAENGRQPLTWNERLHNLAVFRAKDTIERNYFDHVTPEGKCVGEFVAQFGLKGVSVFHNEADYRAASSGGTTVFRAIAENLGGVTYDAYSGEPLEPYTKSVDGWMASRGHRYALMYPSYENATIGCYKSVCVFLGLSSNLAPLGILCVTGEEGLSYWETAPLQLEEIPS